MPFLHTELLDSLKVRVQEQIEMHRTRMEKGIAPDEYRELVGRCKEARALIGLIDETKKENEEDADEDQ